MISPHFEVPESCMRKQPIGGKMALIGVAPKCESSRFRLRMKRAAHEQTTLKRKNSTSCQRERLRINAHRVGAVKRFCPGDQDERRKFLPIPAIRKERPADRDEGAFHEEDKERGPRGSGLQKAGDKESRAPELQEFFLVTAKNRRRRGQIMPRGEEGENGEKEQLNSGSGHYGQREASS